MLCPERESIGVQGRMRELSYKPHGGLTEISGDESGTVGVWATFVKVVT